MGMIIISSSTRANFNSDMKKLRFLMFHFVPLALANLQERRHRLIILCIWNIIFSDFLLFVLIPHFRCKTPSLGEMNKALKSIFWLESINKLTRITNP